MKDGLYSDKIMKLIEHALSDGELTEKEKKVLFKNAKEEGIDLDEFEMVLESKLDQIKKDKVVSNPPPKSNKHGEVKKCSACGAMVAAFSTVCSDCGFEFNNIAANNSVKQLTVKLESVVLACDKKSYEREDQKEEDILSKQREVIKNFPIPNTREDLLELLHFMLPKTKPGFFSDKHYSAWRSKFLEILNRAKSAYSNDSKVMAEIENYEKQLKTSFFMSMISKFNELSSNSKISILVVVGFIVFFSSMGIYNKIKERSEKESRIIEENVRKEMHQKLQETEIKIKKLLKDGKFEETEKLVLTLNHSSELRCSECQALTKSGKKSSEYDLPDYQEYWSFKKECYLNAIEKKRNIADCKFIVSKPWEN